MAVLYARDKTIATFRDVSAAAEVDIADVLEFLALSGQAADAARVVAEARTASRAHLRDAAARFIPADQVAVSA